MTPWQLVWNLVLSVGLVYFMGANGVGASPLPAAFELGVTHIQAQQFLQAIADFSEAIAANPHNSGAYTNRCFAQLQVENYQAAILDCTDALSLGRTEDALLNRGIAHYRQANFPQAIADFDAVISHNSQSAEAYLNRGIAESELGNLSTGLSDLVQAAKYFWLRQDLISCQQVKARIKGIQLEFNLIA
ncbi:MAG: tetratricopeptide repeat protein [Pseudanabaenaceae cyanobacterium bins.68]|nr:tetratricopeptide repeat protein [Pseudanabaenaceae cyanobacterium bins.68]